MELPSPALKVTFLRVQRHQQQFLPEQSTVPRCALGSTEVPGCEQLCRAAFFLLPSFDQERKGNMVLTTEVCVCSQRAVQTALKTEVAPSCPAAFPSVLLGRLCRRGRFLVAGAGKQTRTRKTL